MMSVSKVFETVKWSKFEAFRKPLDPTSRVTSWLSQFEAVHLARSFLPPSLPPFLPLSRSLQLSQSGLTLPVRESYNNSKVSHIHLVLNLHKISYNSHLHQ